MGNSNSNSCSIGQLDNTDNRETPRRNPKRPLVASALWFIAASLCVHSLAGFYYVLCPATHWLEYTKLEPIKDTFRVGEELHFRSSFHTNRQASINFNDFLVCEMDGDSLGFHRYGRVVDKTYHLGKTVINNFVFPFEVRVDDPGTCYLQATIILELPLNIKRIQKAKTKTFRVEP